MMNFNKTFGKSLSLMIILKENSELHPLSRNHNFGRNIGDQIELLPKGFKGSCSMRGKASIQKMTKASFHFIV